MMAASRSDRLLRQVEALRDIRCSHIGFEILRDHIFDIFHSLLRREESAIPDSFTTIVSDLVEAM